MLSTNETLVQHLKEMIEVYRSRYDTSECYIFFSKDDESDPFCDQAIHAFHSFLTLDLEQVGSASREMAKMGITYDTPYLVVINIVKSFKRNMMDVLLQNPSTHMAVKFYQLANAMENCIAQAYLNFEIDNFIKYNKIRMTSIKKLNHIGTLHLYEAHLLWFDSLVISLRDMDMSKMPELNPNKCLLGQWLQKDASKVLTDPVLLEKFTSLHKNLHLIAKNIEFSFSAKPIDFDIIILLLKKAELFSLSLGVELSIINNINYQATASKDPLTGALNRQLLFHIFSTQFELSRATDKSFCLIMIDLDDFKLVNDTYGHIEGDKVLKSFSKMISHNLRESDFIIRYGGEEFLLILPSSSLKNALVLAENMRISTQSLKEEYGLQKSVTASFGVVEVIPEAKDIMNEAMMSHYIEEADQELYYAKQHGKNQVSSAHSKKDPIHSTSV